MAGAMSCARAWMPSHTMMGAGTIVRAPLAAVSLEGPDGRGGGLAADQRGEVFKQQAGIKVIGQVVFILGERVVVGEIVVG